MPYQYDGDLLADFMEAAGLDDAELALELGVSRSCITLYRLGYRQPPPPKLVALAALLDRHVEDLFVKTDEQVAAQ
jgi:transcriptional regulator with XRE-family HTH domain